MGATGMRLAYLKGHVGFGTDLVPGKFVSVDGMTASSEEEVHFVFPLALLQLLINQPLFFDDFCCVFCRFTDGARRDTRISIEA